MTHKRDLSPPERVYKRKPIERQLRSLCDRLATSLDLGNLCDRGPGRGSRGGAEWGQYSEVPET